MERLTTDAPETNWHVLMNYAYAKDGEVRLTYGERSEDVALADYISSCAKEFLGCNVLREDVLNGDSCAVCDCPLSVLNAVATQAATLRAKVKKYEDLEEQGRLVVLPCKVGDAVYRIASGRVGGKTRASYSGAYVIQEFKISCDYVTGNGLDMFAHMILDGGRPATSYEIFSSNNIGKTVFLTRAEAEKAMEVSEDA